MSTPAQRGTGSPGAEEISRALRLLAQRGATAEGSVRPGTGAGIHVSGAGAGRSVPAGVWSHLLRHGWVERDGANGRWRISQHGRAELRRKLSAMPADDAGIARPGVRPPSADKPGLDAAECPVSWLARRRDKNGAPLISAEQLAAAERLRADFWFAGMTPRVTTNWSAALTGGGRSTAGAGVDIQDAVIAAGVRVRHALAAVPDVAGLLIDVCCHLKGLEQVERGFSWPPRTAKIVLGIALNQLARHYGITPSAPVARDRPSIRHWGTDGYRPRIDGPLIAASDGAIVSADTTAAGSEPRSGDGSG